MLAWILIILLIVLIVTVIISSKESSLQVIQQNPLLLGTIGSLTSGLVIHQMRVHGLI